MIAPAGAPVARRTQAERRAITEDRLLEAAAALIVERGIQGTSLADIGERAGYSHGIANHHFGSKAALLHALAARVDLYFTERVAATMDASSGYAGLESMVSAYLALTTSDEVLGRVHLVLWAEAIAHNPELKASRVEWDGHFRDGVRKLIAGGVADRSIALNVSAEAMAVAIVGVLRGVVLQRWLDPACTDAATSTAAIHSLISSMHRESRVRSRVR
jgi:AcrR family transcriptional regulator